MDTKQPQNTTSGDPIQQEERINRDVVEVQEDIKSLEQEVNDAEKLIKEAEASLDRLDRIDKDLDKTEGDLAKEQAKALEGFVDEAFAEPEAKQE